MMKKFRSFLIVLAILASFQIIPLSYASSSASLKSWQYIGMEGQEQGYKNLAMSWKASQGFQVPRTFSCKKVSIYAEESSPEKSSTKKENMTIASRLVYVEVWREMSTLLASGSVYVNYLNWYDVTLSTTVTFSQNTWYYIIAYTNTQAFNLYYHNDGSPNNQGPAAWNRFGYWESLNIDFLIRYYAEFTITSSRQTQLKGYADQYKPSLQYKSGENYFPCDFYYDIDRDVSNNPTLYNTYTLSQKMDQLRYFTHIQEYAWDDDISEEAIAIEYWYYYVADSTEGAYPGHKHDWEIFIIFLKQTNPSQVLRLKAGQHGSLVESTWGSAIKEGSTHTRLYLDMKHATFFSKPGGFIDGVKVSYSDSRNKPIYVWDTNAIVSTSGDYDKITNWEGYHVYWDSDSQYWWAWKYDAEYGAWRKLPWKVPEENSY